ncbi:ANK_REP_REGION domain-containing protein [Durusdinium trenchii]|uniref:ANK_REP_REGION domain-containing protein n=1 Tax=Durusdinium trenchii TaxID=1381693 RepID=A0ABP0N7M6_9DINO
MAWGAQRGCGRCFFYLGAMLALGEPETNISARFKVLQDGNIEFRWARGLSRAEGLPPSISTLDRPAIAYYVGAEKGDPLAVLAFSYYVLNRITLGSPGAAWWTTTQHSPASALRRKPWREEATPALCQRILRTLENVADTAARNEVSITVSLSQDNALDFSDLNFYVQNATEVKRAKKEHADWIRAHSKDGDKQAEVVEAMYLFHGDADLNLSRNVSRALELFEASARITAEAAWNSMLLHARGGHDSKIVHHAQNIIQDPEATPLQKTMSQHYLHRFGADDTLQNSTRAGVYLLAAAELGDSNAQQMIAHAYAGLDLPELNNVKVPGTPNAKRALHFYMKAAKQGRPVSAVNAVSLMLRQGGGKDCNSDERCRAAVETLRDVALSYHPEVLRLHNRARHAFDTGDEEGALISFALLSEPWMRRLDADQDGTISPAELLTDFQGVHVRADILLERVKLEDGLLGFLQQILGFKEYVFCRTCFLQSLAQPDWIKVSTCTVPFIHASCNTYYTLQTFVFGIHMSIRPSLLNTNVNIY